MAAERPGQGDRLRCREGEIEAGDRLAAGRGLQAERLTGGIAAGGGIIAAGGKALIPSGAVTEGTGAAVGGALWGLGKAITLLGFGLTVAHEAGAC
jgi:hypothetical protein